MKLGTKIKRTKKDLILRAKDKGIYENFGQKEVGNLETDYINISDYSEEMNKKRYLIKEFNNWCMTFDISKI